MTDHGRPSATFAAFRRRTALLALASLAVAACGRGGADAQGRAPRVVSLSPSTTESMFAIGADAALVGRSRQCDFPVEAARLPSVGGYADPSLEAIIALAPTLVIGARGPAGPGLEQALRAHGVATFFPETESIAQIEEMLADLGRRLDATPGADRAVARIRARRRAVEGAVKTRPRIRVALVFDTSPIFVAGPGSFPDELIRLAGGENVITRGGAYPTVGVEHLLTLDPEVLLDGATDEVYRRDPAHAGVAAERPSKLSALRDAPGWSAMRAIREGRARRLDSDTALRPGPRIGEGLVAVARALHGGALVIPDDGSTPPSPGSAGPTPPAAPNAP